MSTSIVYVRFGTTWADATQRQYYSIDDQFPLAVSRDARIESLLMVDPWRSWPRRALRSLSGRARLSAPLPPHTSLFQPLRMRKRMPNNDAAVFALYRRHVKAIATHLKKTAEPGPSSEAIFVSGDPIAAAVAIDIWDGPVALLAFDDWSKSDFYADVRTAIETSYERIARSPAKVIAVSAPILDRLSPKGATLLLPNGVAPERWESLDTAQSVLPHYSDGPRAVYAGSIENRISVAALESLHHHRPDTHVFFIGPVFDDAHFKRLCAVPNVTHLGRLSHPQLAATIAAADVCLIPHRRTPLTEAMSPLKAYEYVAAGRPVASVRIAPLENISDRIIFSEHEEDFGAAVDKALTLAPMQESDRLAFLDEHSWERKMRTLMDFVLA